MSSAARAGVRMVHHPHYLKEWREARGLTQDALGSQIGVTKGTISRWEAGKRRMDTDDLVNCAKALGVEPLALFRSPADHEGAQVIERFARLVDRLGAARAARLLDALDDAT